MDFERLRRRTYLGGMAASLTGLAGCPGSDAGAENDMETPTQQSLRAHDHSSVEAGGSSIAPASLHGQVYAAAMEGADLSAKVSNAIDAVPAGGTVVITPREDGDPWTWAETLTINLNETGAVNISCRGMTMIEYPGDGWAIETTYRPAEYGMLGAGDFLTLQGGLWRLTGNPDGWLHMVDTNYSEIHPQLVLDVTNDEGTATAIRVECEQLFCENNVFTGHYGFVDVGMDFVPGEGTSSVGDFRPASFSTNYIRNVKLHNVRTSGLRVREHAVFTNCTLQNTGVWTGLENQADEVTMYDLSGDFNGTVFITPRIEDASASESSEANDTGFKLRQGLETPPLIVSLDIDSADVNRLVDRADEFKRLPALQVTQNGYAGIHDVGRRDQEARFQDGGVRFPGQALLGSGSAEPTTEGEVIYHDGSNDIPKGLYRADPENSQWVYIEDNSVTIDD